MTREYINRHTLIVLILVFLSISSVSAGSSQGDQAMTSESLSKELVSALEAENLDDLMNLVARDITCHDGSTYDEVKNKMSAFFDQVSSLKVKPLTTSQVDSTHYRIKTELEFTVNGDGPHKLTLFFLVTERAEGHQITDIYDEAEYQKRDLELYKASFNRDGLPETILQLIDWRCGVWVGQDIELVRTRKMEIRFQRDGKAPEGLWSQFSLLRYTESGIEQNIRALVYANSAEKILKTHVQNLGTFVEDQPYMTDPDLAEHVVPRTFRIVSSSDAAIVLETDDGERERILRSGRIEHFDASGSLMYKLNRIETFDVLDQKLVHKKLSESTIGDCLRSWQMGSWFGLEEGVFKRAIITTRHHTYIFEVRKGFCYCRAARYATCEKGMVFAQNLRLMVKAKEFSSFMTDENEQIAREKLIVDKSLFNPDVCVYTPEEKGGWKAGIYWSVKTASDDLIELHGCGGDTYRYSRPRSETDRVEWFR